MLRTKQLPNKDLSAAVTGLRDGDVLIGRLSSNNDAIVRISFDDPATQAIPPSAEAIGKAFEPENRAATLATLRSLPYFRSLGLNDADLEGYMKRTARSVPMFQNVFETIPGLCVQFITFGTPDGTKPQHFLTGRMAGEAEREKLLSFDTPQSYQRVILSLAPNMRTDDVAGGSGVLVTTLDQWVPVVYDRSTRGTHTGRVYNVATGTVRTVSPADGTLWLYHMRPYGAQEAALALEAFQSFAGVWAPLAELAAPWQVPSLAVQQAEPILRDLTLGALKSVVQKLIRYRPRVVMLPAEPGQTTLSVRVDGRHFLILAALVAATHRGTFVPDQQMFQSGAHSFAKRLLVILYEDARPPPLATHGDALRGLALAAMVAQADPEWRPPLGVLQQWITLALYGYDTSAHLPHPPPKSEWAALPWTATVQNPPNDHAFLSILLDAMGSFEGDKNLLRQAAGWGHVEPHVRDLALPQPDTMPLWHYLDQHVDANIVYCFNGGFLAPLMAVPRVPGHGPYDKFLSQLFEAVAGANSRKEAIDSAHFEQRPFVAAQRQAARRLYEAKRLRAVKAGLVTEAGEERVYTHALEDGWLAAMIGQIPVSDKKRNYFVLLDTRDITEQPDVIRAPARGLDAKTAAEPLPVDVVTTLVSAAYAHLETAEGLPLQGCDAPDPFFRGGRARRRLDPETGELLHYEVRSAGENKPWVSWDQARMIYRRLNATGPAASAGHVALGPFMDAHPIDHLLVPAHRMRNDVFAAADALVDEAAVHVLGRSALQRLLQWLRPRGAVILVPNVTRDVGAAKEALSAADPEAYRFLCLLATLYPAALVLEAGSVTRFQIKEPLVVWDLAARLQRHFRERMRALPGADDAMMEEAAVALPWPSVATLGLFSYQQQALKDVATALDAGMPGSVVWMTVGAGKTRLAGAVASLLAEREQRPRYVFYAGPKKAITGNAEQLKALGFPVRVILSAAAGKVDGAFAPDTITFIEADALRALSDRLEPLAPDALVIIDELHMYMDPTTQRTQAGTMLALLARFFIGMTGTLITDNNPMTVGRWLGYLVPFPVTRRNVWVAAMSIAHYEKAPPAVPEHREITFADTALPDAYWQQLPERFGGLNPRSSPDVFHGLFEHCYQQAYTRMIQEAILLLGEPAPVVDAMDIDAASDSLSQRYADWGGRAHALVFVVRRKADIVAVRPRLVEAALRAGVIATAAQVGVLGENGLNHLTDGDAAADPVARAMRVVFITADMDKGFELSRCNVMLLSVYFSRLAKRRQREGRINRTGQVAPVVQYVTVHGGLLSRTLLYYNEAGSMEQALMQLATQVDV